MPPVPSRLGFRQSIHPARSPPTRREPMSRLRVSNSVQSIDHKRETNIVLFWGAVFSRPYVRTTPDVSLTPQQIYHMRPPHGSTDAVRHGPSRLPIDARGLERGSAVCAPPPRRFVVRSLSQRSFVQHAGRSVTGLSILRNVVIPCRAYIRLH